MTTVRADPAMLARLRQARAVEDGALRQWTQAVAGYERARLRRDRAIARAADGVRRAMAPLLPHYYCRIEAKLTAKDYQELARFDGRRVARVCASGPAVNEARTRLAEVTAAEDAKLCAAKQARAQATAELIRVAADRAPMMTGLSPQQLGTMRSGR